MSSATPFAVSTSRIRPRTRSTSSSPSSCICAGVRPPSEPAPTATSGDGYAEGTLVRHPNYGVGRVTEVTGYGAMRRIKVRFSSYGEKTFVLDKVKLAIVRKG